MGAMHIVVAGESELALRITEALMNEHDVVLVTSDPNSAARIEHLDVHVVEGSASSLATLREARTEKADFFIAASNSDERNIVGCIAADRLGARRRICVLHSATDQNLDQLDDVSLASSVDINAVVRPAEHLTAEILRIVKVPGALDVRAFFDGRVGLLKALVEEGAEVARKGLDEVGVPSGIRVVMVHRGARYFVPSATERLEPDDRVILIGHSRRMVRFARQQFRSPAHQKEKRRAVICGGGSVGLGVARGLREAGWWVKIIEQSLERCEFLSERLNCLVLQGDGSDIDLLREEHVETTAALIAVTNNDEKNLLISLIAKQLGVERIITRADRAVNERVFDKVGIDVVLSARGAAVRSVVSDIVNADRDHVAELEHGELTVLDIALPSHFEPRTLAAAQPRHVGAIGALLRGKKVLSPKDDTELIPGDHVLVVCRTAEVDLTRAHFAGRVAGPPTLTGLSALSALPPLSPPRLAAPSDEDLLDDADDDGVA